jgi:hypothetical protein
MGDISTCDKCGRKLPSAPIGTIHKCGLCSGGMMVRDTTLPPKPEAVAHVSDQHWEAALVRSDADWTMYKPTGELLPRVIDHARCLILLNEVQEPVDLIDDAIWALHRSYEEKGIFLEPVKFRAACRKHFAGLKFPEAG